MAPIHYQVMNEGSPLASITMGPSVRCVQSCKLHVLLLSAAWSLIRLLWMHAVPSSTGPACLPFRMCLHACPPACVGMLALRVPSRVRGCRTRMVWQQLHPWLSWQQRHTHRQDATWMEMNTVLYPCCNKSLWAGCPSCRTDRCQRVLAVK